MKKTLRITIATAVASLCITRLLIAQAEAAIPELTTVTVSASADTFLSEHAAFGGPTGVNGFYDQLWLVRAIDGLHRSFPLVQFDLTSYAGQTISGPTAELVLYIRSGYAGLSVSQSVSVRESLVGWDEATASWANFGGTGFNEATQTGANLVTQTVTYNGVTEPVSFEIPSSVVQDWIDDPSSNHGLFLISNTPQMETDLAFWSNEGGAGPELSFTLVPEPTTFALLGLGSLALVMRRRRHTKA